MKNACETKTLSSGAVQRLYDRLGRRYDWFSFYEARGKARAMQLLDLAAGQWALNVGVGTGKEHQIIQASVRPGGRAYGIDLSAEMVRVAHQRSGAPLVQADARRLPFPLGSFDRLYCAYVLDLLPLPDLPALLDEFRRLLRPGGQMVIISLTEGVTPASRALVGLWKLAYAASPLSCGGCRPLQLHSLVQQAGFEQVRRETLVQWGVPSEIIQAISSA